MNQNQHEIIIDEQTIILQKSYKFLELILDRKLRFKKHAAYALEKGLKWVGQFR